MTQIFPPGTPLKSIQSMLIVDIDVFPVTQVINITHHTYFFLQISRETLKHYKNYIGLN